MVVEHLAKRCGLKFKNESELCAKTALWKRENESTLLLLPQTYMNESGLAVRRAMDYFHVNRSDILVVTDDVAIRFGEVRFREKGSSGGHKGLLSIEETLTQGFARLRLGVDCSKEIPLENYVLSPFSEEEKSSLDDFIERASNLVEAWCFGGVLQVNKQLVLMKKGENKKNEKGENPAIRGDVHPESDAERRCP